MLKPDWIRWCADQYRGDLPADHPGCSPLFDDLSDLPPTLVHVGSEEILLSDSERLVAKLENSGVQTSYRVFEGVGHVFQFLTRLLPQAHQSIEQTSQFVSHLEGQKEVTDYDYDFVVVGSGFGGSTSALRLSEKGYTVGVLEMGRRWTPETLPKSNWNVSKYIWRPMIGLKGFFNMRPFKHAMIIHGNAVGGGSITYAQTLLVPPKKIWEEGTWAGLDDWSSVMPKHYETAQKMLGVTEAKRLGPADHALKKMADAYGVGDTFYKSEVGVFFGDDDDTAGGKTYADPYFGGEGPDRTSCVGCGECMTGCRHNAKNTLDKNYLYLAEKRGVKVHEETEVIDVKPINGKADGSDGYEITTQLSGSWLGKNRRKFRARNVIFAASSLGTQELLFKLKQSGSLPRVSDELGKRVRTNSESIVCVRMPDGEDMSKGVGIGSGIYIDKDTHVEAMRYGAGHDLLGTTFTPLTDGKEGWTRILTWVQTMTLLLLTRPVTFFKVVNPVGFAKQTIMLLCLQALDGHLNMRYRRPWYNPFIKVLQTEGEGVPAFIPQANEFAKQSAKLMNGVALSGTTEILFNVPTTGHCMGGAGMGQSRETGVVDFQNRVFGYKNMWVCDASVLSANLGVNPALTITALTERAMSFIPNKAGVEQPKQVFIPINLARAA
jgi:cholesterol oxidase